MQARTEERPAATLSHAAGPPPPPVALGDGRNVTLVKEYFRRVDAGEDASPLFSPDFDFYYPKFGKGSGPESFGEFATGLLGVVRTIAHPVEAMIFIEQGDRIVVEGEFSGELQSGERWEASKTPTGRFCSSFTVREGLIARMYIYVDPDYASHNTAGFLWGRDRSW